MQNQQSAVVRVFNPTDHFSEEVLVPVVLGGLTPLLLSLYQCLIIGVTERARFNLLVGSKQKSTGDNEDCYYVMS